MPRKSPHFFRPISCDPVRLASSPSGILYLEETTTNGAWCQIIQVTTVPPPSLLLSLAEFLTGNLTFDREPCHPGEGRRASAIAATSIIARLAVAEKRGGRDRCCSSPRATVQHPTHFLGKGVALTFSALLRPPPLFGRSCVLLLLLGDRNSIPPLSPPSSPCWNSRATMRTSKDGVRGGPVSLFFFQSCVCNKLWGRKNNLPPPSFPVSLALTVSFPLP